MKNIFTLLLLISLSSMNVSEPIESQWSFDNYVGMHEFDLGSGMTMHRIVCSRRNKKVKAKYFAFKDNATGETVHDRYKKWKNGKRIIAYSSAAYIDRYDNVPDGITIDDGRKVNRQPHSSMDALVIVEAVGGVRVTDMEEANLKVYHNDGSSDLLNLKNTWDFNNFLTWANEQKANCFQQHLLVFRDALTVGIKARTELAERRFLALCEDTNGNIYHIIYNIEQKMYLYDAATRVKDLINSSGSEGLNCEVIAMINLDTGMQNVFNAFNDSGYEMPGYQGTTPISEATNLLVYYYE